MTSSTSVGPTTLGVDNTVQFRDKQVQQVAAGEQPTASQRRIEAHPAETVNALRVEAKATSVGLTHHRKPICGSDHLA